MDPVIIHPRQPMADGIFFDDTYFVEPGTRRELAARGLVWLTSFEANGKAYGGRVIAANEPAAAAIADARGLGEIVIGQLECEVA